MNDFLNAAAKQLNEMRLTAEGAIVIYEAYSITNVNRPDETTELFDLIGAALYSQKAQICSLQELCMQEAGK